MTDPRAGGEVWLAERPRLVGLAYRLLGSIAEAEDVVSEVYLRLRRGRPRHAGRPRRLAHHRDHARRPRCAAEDGEVIAVFSLEVADDRITAIRVLRNPAKLGSI